MCVLSAFVSVHYKYCAYSIYGGWKRVSDPFGTGVTMVASCPVGPGIQPGSSGRALSALNC